MAKRTTQEDHALTIAHDVYWTLNKLRTKLEAGALAYGAHTLQDVSDLLGEAQTFLREELDILSWRTDR
jgi:hypothetical protein